MKKFNVLVNRLVIRCFAITVIIFTSDCAGGQSNDFKMSDKFSLLWEITGNGSQKPSYLFGTIHLYDSTIFKIPAEVYTAIERCDNFALEINFNNINQSEMFQRVMINDADSTLDKLLEPDVYAEMQKVPIINMMGEVVNMMKPFYIMQYLLIENPLTIQSVDMNLNSYANRQSKHITGIETIDEQLDMVNAMSLAKQAQDIKDIYDYCKREQLSGFQEAGKKLFHTIQMAYKEQDFGRLVNLEDEFKMTSNYDSDATIIGQRNVNMANRIDDFIKHNKTLFVAIGALHLPDYKDLSGVVALLKEKGYNLRPVLIDLNND